MPNGSQWGGLLQTRGPNAIGRREERTVEGPAQKWGLGNPEERLTVVVWNVRVGGRRRALT
jgi:hypothetical protein